MFLKNLFTILCFLSFSSVIFANAINQGECDEILKLSGIEGCTPNKDGSIDTVNIGSTEFTQDSINKLSKYDIRNITIRMITIANVTNFEPISSITNLHSINIESDVIKQIPKNFIKYLKHLKSLRILHIELNQEIIEEVSTLADLEKLMFIYCSFDSTLDYNPLKKLSKLELLTMEAYEYHHHRYNKRFTEIPEFIFELKNLKQLTIGDHEITKIPEKLSNLKKLEVLNLSANKIDDVLPESLNTLPELREIYLQYNVNIKGKTLTNAKLESCRYDDSYTLCKAKDMTCLEGYYFEKCSDMDNENYTTNGQCGNGNGRCPDGFCCSKDGWCGKTESHCSILNGCQYQFGTCKGESNQEPQEQETSNGKCGKGIGKCQEGQCCNKYGYCGKTDNHCLVSHGCQSEFGTCHLDKISVDGKCGPLDGRCPNGQCCSKYGWCGSGSNYCDAGCQSLYGKCNGN